MDFNKPQINYSGGDWAELKRWLEEELHTTYQRITALNATEAETQQLRGRASLISRMLDFAKAPAAFSPQNNN